MSQFAPLAFGASGIGGNPRMMEAPYLGVLGSLLNRARPGAAGGAPPAVAPPQAGAQPNMGSPPGGSGGARPQLTPNPMASVVSNPSLPALVAAYQKARNPGPGQPPLPDDVQSAYQTVLLHLMGLS